MIETRTIDLSTRGNADCHDVTSQVSKIVADTGLRSGMVTLFCPSSTSGVTTIEFETGAVSDLQRLFDEIIAPGREYTHNARWGDGNGHSHVRAALLGPSLTVPFVEGQLALGAWQQIVHLDFDVRPRQREIVVQIIGE
ncbi:MAG TPA: secondary thiamine-phosphate synthase enzyme YjbQ [Anaerolineales bacterium]